MKRKSFGCKLFSDAYFTIINFDIYQYINDNYNNYNSILLDCMTNTSIPFLQKGNFKHAGNIYNNISYISEKIH